MPVSNLHMDDQEYTGSNTSTELMYPWKNWRYYGCSDPLLLFYYTYINVQNFKVISETNTHNLLVLRKAS